MPETLPLWPTPPMAVTLVLVAAMVVLFVRDRWPLDVTAPAILGAALLAFQVVPVPGPDGANRLGPAALLSGFANPALITVVALLVVGEGLTQAGALDRLARRVAVPGRGPRPTVALVLLVVTAASAFLNNTPMVVVFIPVLQALAAMHGFPPNRAMLPLSYVAILGGMTTLLGSSTNLLVSGVLADMGRAPFGFFEFTPVALPLVAAGLLYVGFVVPRLLRAKPSLCGRMTRGGRHFVAQLRVPGDSPLVGRVPGPGTAPLLAGMYVRAVERADGLYAPPFTDMPPLEAGDVLLVAATRRALADAHARHPGLVVAGSGDAAAPSAAGAQELVEAMVPPASRLVGQTLRLAAFRQRFGCTVLGIQRRERMYRERVADVRLEPGDVLLVLGTPGAVEALRLEHDVLVISGSRAPLARPGHAGLAGGIFAAVIAAAASGVVPVAAAAVAGAAAMLALGVLNPRQAGRAVDRRVVLLIGAALALGEAMRVTGTAAWLAHGLAAGLADAGPAVVLSGFFLLVAGFTNILSNNACAVLFAPIGLALAGELDVAPRAFAVATVLAANCSFASPVGYQTNLLVMAPGQYRVKDFVRAGAPLVILLWAVFTAVAPLFWAL